MIEAILLDLNGTLLDLAALDPHFARLFGDAGARERWFAELQVLWMTTIATGDYRDFPELAEKGQNTTVLVNRGWISKDKASQSTRPDSLQTGEVVIEGLLREPWKKNSFTPVNSPEKNLWHFPDVHEMASHVGSQAIWIEETMSADLLKAYDDFIKALSARNDDITTYNSLVQRLVAQSRERKKLTDMKELAQKGNLTDAGM